MIQGPKLRKIITADHPGEFRAVALDALDRPWASFIQRWDGKEERLRLGQCSDAIIRARAEEQGGYFLDLPQGESVFLRTAPDLPPMLLGGRVRVVCLAEAQQAKLARVRLIEQEPADIPPYQLWKARLKGHEALEEQADPDRVDAAFEEAVSTRLTLPGGGQIHLQTLTALMAVDIDTSGRTGKGSAGARALSLNREAVHMLARQICLRDLGGLIVVDLVGPLNHQAGKKVQEMFLQTLKSMTDRQVKCLRPSALNLMEISVERQLRPLPDLLCDAQAQARPETQLLDLLKQAERDMSHRQTRFFSLSLCRRLHPVYVQRQEQIDQMLKSRFSGRLSIETDFAAPVSRIIAR